MTLLSWHAIRYGSEKVLAYLDRWEVTVFEIRKARRGFASMSAEKQREIASEGGKPSGGNFKNDPERASEAGKKGGEASHGGRGSSGGRS